MFLQAQFNFDVSTVINEIFAGSSLNTIGNGFLVLGGLAAIIYMAKVASEFAVIGKVQYVKLGPLIIYGLLVGNWSALNTQLDTGLKSMQTVFQSATPVDAQSTKEYQKLMERFGVIPADGGASIEDPNSPKPPTTANLGGTDEGLLSGLDAISEKFTYLMNIIQHPEVIILKIMMVFMYLFNMAITVLFNAFTYLWINLLRIGGPFALALYFFPKMAGSFSYWIKAYIGVYLWIPIGSIMIYVSDQIFIKIVSQITLQDPFWNISNSMPVMSPNVGFNMALIAVAALATTFLKCILLSKVPTIIQYWTGGGGTNDMFSSGAASGMMAVQGASAVVSGGASVATGAVGSLKG